MAAELICAKLILIEIVIKRYWNVLETNLETWTCLLKFG